MEARAAEEETDRVGALLAEANAVVDALDVTADEPAEPRDAGLGD